MTDPKSKTPSLIERLQAVADWIGQASVALEAAEVDAKHVCAVLRSAEKDYLERIAGLERQNKQLQSAMPQPCCQEWDSCIRTCVPRLERQLAEAQGALEKIRREPTPVDPTVVHDRPIFNQWERIMKICDAVLHPDQSNEEKP